MSSVDRFMQLLLTCDTALILRHLLRVALCQHTTLQWGQSWMPLMKY